MELLYNQGNHHIGRAEPSPEEVEACIRSLNNDDRSTMRLILLPYQIQVWGANAGRVLLRYSEYEVDGVTFHPIRAARLSDPEVPEEHVIAINTGKQTQFSLTQTVTVDKAIEVVLHVMRHRRFPENLVWSEW